LPLTDDPDLHLLVDGRRIDAIERTAARHVFRLGMRPSVVRIRSRATAPQEIGIARDPRCLGVAVRSIILAQPGRRQIIGAREASLADGFHSYEAGDNLRWTDGGAAIPAEYFAGLSAPWMLILNLGASTHYVDEGQVATAA
jgi:hypothetical protein